MPLRFAAVALLLLSIAPGCRSPLGPATLLPADDPRPARLLASWEETASARVGLRGRARLAVDAESGGAKLRGRQILVVERPTRLRVEIKALFDQTVAVLVTDGGEFELLRADDRSYRRGAIEPGLLWETAWLDLEPAEAIALLVAAPDLGNSTRPDAARALADGGIEIDLMDAEGRLSRRVGFDGDDRLRSVERFRVDGGRAWRAEYDRYEDVGDDEFPHRLRIATAEETSAEIVLSAVELNPDLPASLFRIRR